MHLCCHSSLARRPFCSAHSVLLLAAYFAATTRESLKSAFSNELRQDSCYFNRQAMPARSVRDMVRKSGFATAHCGQVCRPGISSGWNWLSSSCRRRPLTPTPPTAPPPTRTQAGGRLGIRPRRGTLGILSRWSAGPMTEVRAAPPPPQLLPAPLAVSAYAAAPLCVSCAPLSGVLSDLVLTLFVVINRIDVLWVRAGGPNRGAGSPSGGRGRPICRTVPSTFGRCVHRSEQRVLVQQF